MSAKLFENKRISLFSQAAGMIRIALTGCAVVGMLLIIQGIPEADAQVGSSVLRSQSRAISRPIGQQARRALKPTLTIRSGALDRVDLLKGTPGGRFLAMAASDDSLRVWDMALGGQILHLDRSALPARKFTALAVADDGRSMIAIAEGGKLVGWRLEAQEPTVTRILPVAQAQAVAALADYRLVVAAEENRLLLLDHDFAMQPIATSAHGVVTTLEGDRDGGLLVGHGDGTVMRLAEVGGSWRETGRWKLSGRITALLTIPRTGGAGGSDARVVVATGDGNISLFEPGSLKPLWTSRPARSGVAALAISGNATLAVLTNGQVHLLDLASGRAQGKTLDLPFRGSATGLAAAPGDNLLISGSGGRVAAINPATRSTPVTLYLTRASWATLDPDGRYDGTVASARDVAWEMDGKLHDLERFMVSYFEPGLAARRLARHGTVLTSPPRTVDEGFFPPPEVAIELVEHGATTAKIRIIARMQGGLVDRETPSLRLFRNGRRIAEGIDHNPEVDTHGNQLHLLWTVDIPLAMGANGVEAAVLTWADVEARSKPLAIEGTGHPAQEPRIIVSGVGINDYADKTLRLDFAVPDATAMVAALAKSEGTKTHQRGGKTTFLHLDAQAGRASLLKHLDELRHTSPEDTVILFLAGHAKAVGDSWYFLPVEAAGLHSDSHVRSVGLSSAAMADALVRVPAGTIVLVIDACQSGAAIDAFDGFAQRRAVTGLSSEAGITVMAATRADQLALEFDALGHGLFTYTMLRGLTKGDDGYYHADRWPRDGRVMISELRHFVEMFMPALAARLEREISGDRGSLTDRVAVTPTLTDVARDFPLR